MNGISPKQIVHQTFIVRFTSPSNGIQLIKRLEAIRNPTVHREVVTVDAGREWELIKHLHHGLIALNVIISDHLGTEVIAFCHFSRLMITS